MDTQLPNGFFRAAVGRVGLHGLQNGGKLIAEEDRDHGGRRFVGAETVIVSGSGHGKPQQILIVVHRLNGGAEEQRNWAFS